MSKKPVSRKKYPLYCAGNKLVTVNFSCISFACRGAILTFYPSVCVLNFIIADLVAEGLYLVPISLKLGCLLGPYF